MATPAYTRNSTISVDANPSCALVSVSVTELPREQDDPMSALTH